MIGWANPMVTTKKVKYNIYLFACCSWVEMKTHVMVKNNEILEDLLYDGHMY